jgi:hypothetical protein
MSITLNSIQFIYFNLNVNQIEKKEFHVERAFARAKQGKRNNDNKKKSDLKDREIIL